MSRIKGWRKVNETKSEIRYRNTKYEEYVKIYPIAQMTHRHKNRWFISNWWGNWHFPITGTKVKSLYSKGFKTKAAALKFARSWMRKHPNG